MERTSEVTWRASTPQEKGHDFHALFQDVVNRILRREIPFAILKGSIPRILSDSRAHFVAKNSSQMHTSTGTLLPTGRKKATSVPSVGRRLRVRITWKLIRSDKKTLLLLCEHTRSKNNYSFKNSLIWKFEENYVFTNSFAFWIWRILIHYSFIQNVKRNNIYSLFNIHFVFKFAALVQFFILLSSGRKLNNE